jgi:hypothetical protein
MKAPHKWVSDRLMSLFWDFDVHVPISNDFERAHDVVLSEAMMEEQTMLMKFAGYLAKNGYIDQLDFEELENLTFDFYHETFKSE